MSRTSRMASALALGSLMLLAQHKFMNAQGAVHGAAGGVASSAPGIDKTIRVPVVFSGGHDTDPRDGGRPVVLVAGALSVPPEVFREAFSHVRPAPAGTQPQPDQVRRNKAALLQALGRYGVTNERLDEVSNYYRYVRSRGEMWPTQPATAFALLKDGKVVGFEVTSGGSGYSSPPVVSVPGAPEINAQAQLAFNPNFERNGLVSDIVLGGATQSGATQSGATQSGATQSGATQSGATQSGTIQVRFTNHLEVNVRFSLNGGKGLEATLKPQESQTYTMSVDKGVAPIVRIFQTSGQWMDFRIEGAGRYDFRAKDGEIQSFRAG